MLTWRRGILLLVVLGTLVPATSLRADTALGPGALLTAAAPAANARFGAAMAVGDVNGDGAADVAVSATGSGAGSGEIHIRLGPALSPGAVISNPNGASSFGSALAMGDINNDGFDDVIAGALGADVAGRIGAGEAWVFFGPSFVARTVLRDPEPQAAAAFGVSVGAGDTNGDGYDEVIVGAWDSNIAPYVKAGQAFVFEGPSLTTVRTLQSPAPQNIGDFGVATTIGDFDGDGSGDAIVGSWISDVQPGDDAGQVFVFRGPSFTEVITLREATSGGRLGQSVTSANIDEDEADEIVAGARGAAVVFDATGPSYTSRVIPLPVAWIATTTSVAAADATGDGRADIAIGAPNAATGGATGGAALFVPSSAANLRYTSVAATPETGARFGAAVALVGGGLLSAAPYSDASGFTDGGALFRTAIIDTDADGALDPDDNCPGAPNPSQRNSDGERRAVAGRIFEDATSLHADIAGDACDADDDNDGLSDNDEAGLPSPACPAATAPTRTDALDSDGDLTSDGGECLLGSDPADQASTPASLGAAADADRDGLPDGIEATIGSDPAIADSDGDGLLDGVEVRVFGSNAGGADTDGDGCSDGTEAASVNDDRTVSAIDLSQVAQAFGARGGAQYIAAFDLNGDARVSAMDLGFVARNFGPC